MKKVLITLLVAVTLFAFNQTTKLALGDAAPLADQQMTDVSGKSYSLNDLKKKNGLLVIFSCNTCPFVLGWEDQYPMLGEAAKNAEIGMVLVNSNEAKRTGEDSMAEMKKHYQSAKYNTPYVVDENSALANAFGANTTPHVYLFDANMKLVYTGSINDKYEQKDKTATTRWLYDAMMNVASGNAAAINPKETKNIGCSIKRK
jgi:thioredoxin-related protein